MQMEKNAFPPMFVSHETEKLHSCATNAGVDLLEAQADAYAM